MDGTPITREWLESISVEGTARHYDSFYFDGQDSDFNVKFDGETDQYFNPTDDCIWHYTISQERLLELFRENLVKYNEPT